MLVRRVIYALAAVWLVLFAAAFVALGLAGPTDGVFAENLNRMVSFLSWHGAALVVAVILAFVTRQALARGVEKIRLIGLLPLGLSVFLIVSLILIIAYRFGALPSLG
jgi:ABC-type sugar transport system permease subunit